MNPSDIFKQPFICYEPEEIKRIRLMLGENRQQFADRFKVSLSAANSWQTPRGKAKHAECLGAASILLFWAAVEANDRGSSKGNLIRLGMRKETD